MSLNKKQEKIIAEFAAKNKNWPREELDLALWRINWDLTALDHQKEPDVEYDTLFLCAGRGAGKTHMAANWIGLALHCMTIRVG